MYSPVKEVQFRVPDANINHSTAIFLRYFLNTRSDLCLIHKYTLELNFANRTNEFVKQTFIRSDK